MATIPLPERNVAIDTLMAVCGEDAATGGRLLDYLNTAFPGFTWAAILRTRAQSWAPWIASGLSIDAFVDECVRYAALYAASRT